LRAVIGIDAAWTDSNPSGVALCVEDPGGWRCAAVAPSYADFVAIGAGTPVNWQQAKIAGAAPTLGPLLAAARAIEPLATLQVIALDIPLSRNAIDGRRKADNDISKSFGAKACSTHSPSAARPGPISTTLRIDLQLAGFPLITSMSTPVPQVPAAIEVYPHVALLTLLHANYRIPYKVSKSGTYWPNVALKARQDRLLAEWRRIVAALAPQLSMALTIPLTFKSAAAMKRYEDAIDALVCAWVGIKYLNGQADAYGDATAAIWVPE